MTAVLITVFTIAALLAAVLFCPKLAIGRLRVDTYWLVPLLGMAVLIFTGNCDIHGTLSAMTADSAVNPFKILVLFLSMTALSVYLDETGFFRYLADAALRRSGHSQRRLFLYLYFTVSVLTVFTSNDIIVLTFTPFICYFAKNAKIDPIPYLVAEFIAANTWSMALVIGNPTNIYLASSYSVSFVEYMRVMLLPTILAGTMAFFVLQLLFRKKLAMPIAPRYEKVEISDRVLLINGIVHLAVCTLLLAAASYVNWEMWCISLAAAGSLLLTTLLICLFRRRKPDILAVTGKRLPWPLVPFVLSMFVLILAVAGNGVSSFVTDILDEGIPEFSYGLSSFFAANLLNNIPMSVFYCTVLESLSGQTLLKAVFATVIGSNIGAFLTPIGALAGIMWSSILKKQNVRFGYGSFVKYGAAVAIPTVLAAVTGLCLFSLLHIGAL